jgi:hypothetical protein
METGISVDTCAASNNGIMTQTCAEFKGGWSQQGAAWHPGQEEFLPVLPQQVHLSSYQRMALSEGILLSVAYCFALDALCASGEIRSQKLIGSLYFV